MLMVLMQLGLYLGLCLTLSPAGQALFYFEFIDKSDYFEYCMILIASLAIFITCAILLLRKHYSELDNQRKFFIISYSAYGIFALISFVCYVKIGDGELYAWLFNLLKLMKFSVRGINTITAVVLTHCFMLALIAFIPIINELTSRAPKRKKNENRISMGLRITDEKNAIKSVRGDGTMVSAASDAAKIAEEQKKKHSHHGHSNNHSRSSDSSSHSGSRSHSRSSGNSNHSGSHSHSHSGHSRHHSSHSSHSGKHSHHSNHRHR